MFRMFLYFSINLTVSTVFVRTEDASLNFFAIGWFIPFVVKNKNIFLCADILALEFY
jgi:hypothetical protein